MDATESVCPMCAATRVHAVLVCAGARLSLTVGAGQRLPLGRDPRWAPKAAPLLDGLDDKDYVSRRHAVVSMDMDGRLWVEEPAGIESTNKTYVDGVVAPPGTRRELIDGARLCLGKYVHFQVSIRGLAAPAC
jgi:hypothetical protein